MAYKVALITGAARRVGAEIVRVLHEAGMNVVIHYYASESAAQDLCQQLNQQRCHSAVALQADLRDQDQLIQLAKESKAVWQRLDVLVNNASCYYRTLLGKVTEQAWDDIINSNLKAPFFLSQATAPFLALHHGCIVNITDVQVERVLRDYSIYCISKSGLLAMTKILAKELGPRIRVNAIAPGPVIWPEGDNMLSAVQKQKIIQRTVLKRLGAPEDVAKAVLFFVRDAQYVTGQVLNVEGGCLL